AGRERRRSPEHAPHGKLASHAGLRAGRKGRGRARSDSDVASAAAGASVAGDDDLEGRLVWPPLVAGFVRIRSSAGASTEFSRIQLRRLHSLSGADAEQVESLANDAAAQVDE